jgi:hypothetical protein
MNENQTLEIYQICILLGHHSLNSQSLQSQLKSLQILVLICHKLDQFFHILCYCREIRIEMKTLLRVYNKQIHPSLDPTQFSQMSFQPKYKLVHLVFQVLVECERQVRPKQN